MINILELMLRERSSPCKRHCPLMPSGGSIVINGSMVSIKGDPAFSV